MYPRPPALGLALVVAVAGCLGAAPPTSPTTDATRAGDTPAEVRVADVAYGDDLRKADRGGFGADDPPEADANGSRIDVSGEIMGIGDPACIDVGANATVAPNGTVTVTVRSCTSAPDGRACNATARSWAYRATVTAGDRRPERIRVRHVAGETVDAWMVSVDGTGA